MDEIWTKWPGEEVGPSAALEFCRRSAASRQEGAPRLDLLAWPRAIGGDGRGGRRTYTAEQATLDHISKLSTASMTRSSEPRSPVWGMTAARPEQRGPSRPVALQGDRFRKDAQGRRRSWGGAPWVPKTLKAGKIAFCDKILDTSAGI